MKKLSLLIIFSLFSLPLLAQDFWELLPFPDDTLSIQCITTNNAGDIFLGLGATSETGGVLRSTDNGETWDLVYNYQFSVLSIACNDNGDIYIGKSGQDQFAVSNDNGETWTDIEITAFSEGTIHKIFCKGNDTIYLGLWPDNGALFVFSEDSGNTWHSTNVTNNYNDYISDIDISSDGTIYISIMCYSPDQGGVYKSEEGGYTWEYVGLLNHQIKALEINSNDDVFTSDWSVMGNLSGIHALYYGTDEFVRIKPASNGRDLAINSQNDIYACYGPNNVFSQDNGLTFELIDDVLPFHLRKLHITNEDFLYGTTSKLLARSINPTITSINTANEPQENHIQIYPNPVGYMLNAYLKTNNITNSIAIVYIYNVSGQLQYKNAHIINNNQLKINTTFLSSGIYVLKICIDNQMYIHKFIKYEIY